MQSPRSPTVRVNERGSPPTRQSAHRNRKTIQTIAGLRFLAAEADPPTQRRKDRRDHKPKPQRPCERQSGHGDNRAAGTQLPYPPTARQIRAFKNLFRYGLPVFRTTNEAGRFHMVKPGAPPPINGKTWKYDEIVLLG